MARLTKEKAKNSRLQIPVDESTSNKIQQVAISQDTQITLGDDDWENFYQALINPPAPNQALKQAFAAYQK